MAEPYLTQLNQIIKSLDLSEIDAALEAKHFFSGAALYADGKICASLSPAGFAIKLPEDQRTRLIEAGEGSAFRFFPKGPIKKEYVALSDSLPTNKELLRALIVMGIEVVIGGKGSTA